MIHPNVLEQLNQEHLKDLHRSAKENRLVRIAQENRDKHSIFQRLLTLNIELNFHLKISGNRAKAGLNVINLANDGA